MTANPDRTLIDDLKARVDLVAIIRQSGVGVSCSRLSAVVSFTAWSAIASEVCGL